MKLNLGHLVLAFILGALVTSGVLVPNVQAANQPHMYNALESLRAAKHQLEIAEEDKAGHRVKALGIVENAIAEVKAGIAAGN
jgi:hypothetical protein